MPVAVLVGEVERRSTVPGASRSESLMFLTLRERSRCTRNAPGPETGSVA